MSTPAPVHVYQTYIRASAEQVWQAITDPEFTKRYCHRTAFESDARAGQPVPHGPARRQRRRRRDDRRGRAEQATGDDLADPLRRCGGGGAAEPHRVAAHRER